MARAVGWDIPLNYPLVGRDAFRTATGVHAAAIIKAMQKGDAWLADRVYSGVPAGMFGRHQEIGIGFMSGASNVVYWLRQRGIEPNEDLVARHPRGGQGDAHILSDDEVMAVVAKTGKPGADAGASAGGSAGASRALQRGRGRGRSNAGAIGGGVCLRRALASAVGRVVVFAVMATASPLVSCASGARGDGRGVCVCAPRRVRFLARYR